MLKPGDILNSRYKIIARLGQGGFGQTYTAKDSQTKGSPVCVVKEMHLPQPQNLRLSKDLQDRFIKEANILSRLGEHPQIPQLFEYFHLAEKYYLIQEYIQGHDLNEEIAPDKPLWNEQQVVSLLQDVLEVLVFVHQQNIIHRDIKPSNLRRRDQDHKIVLLDFGAVKEIGTFMTEPDATSINVTKAIGTPGYMPPEQQNGRPHLNSDLYALGMICIEALTGLHPRTLPSDPSTGNVIWRYSAGERNMVDVSPGLEQIINKMVRYHFRDRYQSATEALADLRQFLDNPVSAVKQQEIPSVGKPTEKSPGKQWLGLGFALGLMVIGVTVWQFSKLGEKTCPPHQGDNISCGEDILTSGEILPEKQEGVTAFAKGKYEQAIAWFEKAREKFPSDPEILIYLNNAKLLTNKIPFYTIAVAVPLGNPSDGGDAGKEILRGVAQVQTKINQDKSINGLGLRVVIADDSNTPNRAQQIARKLASQPDILAVIGHYSSSSTKAALPIYENHSLVVISPTSTAQNLAEDSSVFFRTVPQDRILAQTLAQYLYTQAKQEKVAVFYNPQNAYSRSLHEEFLLSFDQQGGIVIKQFDLSQGIFDAQAAIKQSIERGATGLILFPDARVNPYTFANSLKIIRANQNRYLIAGGDSLYTTAILEEGILADKMIIAISWHDLSRKNQDFARNTHQFWGTNISWRTVMATDATTVLKVALESQPPLTWFESLQSKFSPSQKRLRLLQTLRQPVFHTQGVTGEISFEPSGDRAQRVVELVKVVPSKCSPYGYLFIPIEYKTAQETGLKCDGVTGSIERKK